MKPTVAMFREMLFEASPRTIVECLYQAAEARDRRYGRRRDLLTHQHLKQEESMPLTNADRVLGPGRAWQVEGSVGTQYTVIEWKATRFVSCNCPNWGTRRNHIPGDHTFRGPRENHCKHILILLGDRHPGRSSGVVEAGEDRQVFCPGCAAAHEQCAVHQHHEANDD